MNLSWLNFWKTKKVIPIEARNQRVEYKPGLKEELLEDHKQIFRLWEMLSLGIQKRDHQQVELVLKMLPDMFKAHCAKEEKHVYDYIRYRYILHAEECTTQESKGYFFKRAKTVMALRQQMTGIKRTFLTFCNRWSKPGELSSEVEWLRLEDAYTALGNALTNRVHVEETVLYKHYSNGEIQPPRIKNEPARKANYSYYE